MIENETELITGDEILCDGREFNTRILYMTDEMHDALVLFEMSSHVLDAFTTAPRGLAVAPEKQAGKSTWLASVSMLGCNPWLADPTSYALRSKFNDREKPLLMIDEIAEYYGMNGMRQGPKDLNKILLEGYAKNAKLSLSVDRTSQDISSFCFAAMGGLRNAVRQDIWDRSIVWKMKPAPAGVATRLDDALSDDVAADGKIHQQRFHQWAKQNEAAIKDAFRNFRRPHRKMFSRLRQIWGPLYAVALVAGGDWPERCVAAFKVMALDASELPVLSGEQMILRDTALLLIRNAASALFTRDIRDHLRSLPDSDYYSDLSDRGLAVKISAALGPATSMDIGNERAKGFRATPVIKAWKRLEARLEADDDDGDEADEYDGFFEVTEITEPPAQSRKSRNSSTVDMEVAA